MAEEVIQVELCAPECDPDHLEVTEIIMPGAAGVFAVLPDHTPMLTTLVPGVVVAYSTDGQEHHYAVSSGFAEVLDNRVIVLSQTLEKGDEIDVQRAQAARDRAKQRLSHPSEDIDVARAELALQRALARLQAHTREGY